MGKQYKSLRELIAEFGFWEAVSHKFLELRDRYSLFNRLCSEFIIGHMNSSTYSRSYLASWNSKGKLTYFNPDPNYPKDFIPIDSETGKRLN